MPVYRPWSEISGVGTALPNRAAFAREMEDKDLSGFPFQEHPDDSGPAPPCAVPASARMSLPGVRPAHPWTRLLFNVAALATLAAASQLYLFPADTDRFFAWTIAPTISAAFMGAGFGAGFVLVVGMWRQTSWAAYRLSFLSVLVFSVMTLAATLVHLDRFHFGEGGAAEVAAWLWLAVYVVFPVAMIWLLVLQGRTAGGDPPVASPVPTWLRAVLGSVGAVTVGVGVLLFVLPTDIGDAWPWALTPLVARAFAGWIVGLGLAALLAIRERDLERLRIPAVAYVAFASLMLIALGRFADQVSWSRPSAWFFVIWVVTLGAIGIYGATRRASASTGTG